METLPPCLSNLLKQMLHDVKVSFHLKIKQTIKLRLHVLKNSTTNTRLLSDIYTQI